MKEVLAGIGVILLVVCCWLAVLSYRADGIRRIGPDGAVEVLGDHGWQPAEAGLENYDPVAVPVAEVVPIQPVAAVVPVRPTEIPLPTIRPSPGYAAAAGPTMQPWSSGPTTDSYWLDGGLALYTSDPEPIDLSPWTVLGWILVAIVPLALLGLLVVGVHRYVTWNKKQSATSSSRDAPLPTEDSDKKDGNGNSIVTTTETPDTGSRIPIESYLVSIGRMSIQDARPGPQGLG